MASVPVLHALEFVVTWLPSPSSPAMRALLPLHIVCSTMVLPRRATLPASVRGTSFSAVVSIPPHDVPMIPPLSQSTSSASGATRGRPASVQAATAATAA